MCSWICRPTTQLSDRPHRHLVRRLSMGTWTHKPRNQFCARTSRHGDSGLTIYPWIFRPITELSDRPSRYLDSSFTMCPWTWRPKIQLCTRPRRHQDNKFTICPWTQILPPLHSTSTQTSGLPARVILWDLQTFSALHWFFACSDGDLGAFKTWALNSRITVG